MGSSSLFQYRPGRTPVHSLDTRFKLILMALASVTVLNGSVWALVIMSSATAVLGWYTRLPLLSAIRELRYFFLLLAMVFIARVLSTPGEPLVQIGMLAIGKKGVVQGAVVCWRFLLVAVLGLLFVSTTRISAIKRSVAWFFRPLPGVPEKRVAVTLGLIVRFIPVIFEKAGEVSAAQHARCIAQRKNPVFRLKTFTVPLLKGVFITAGNLAMAMEARCYSEQGIRPVNAATMRDWVVLAAGSSLCTVAFLF